LLKHVQSADEVWHAGDWGDSEVSNQITSLKPVRGVYGNIDGLIIRKTYPKELFFEVEGVKVYITHIGGYPGRYNKGIKEKLQEYQPDLYICGHSHICKVMRDKALNLLHINPGAIGNKGFHKKRTMISLSINDGNIFDVNLIEYDRIQEQV
jgi:putative phosphoesterase